ncbi:carbohydrate ABC transporter substrate-binding protein, CUT1 family [Microbacterium hydrothermale]|uniref:ABC transporter substrate-binding protein n=1 Tax=Microbacterium hydrothermale TaxID=857427 RepID=UPI002226B749|nr:extracellular solute-binding protein [Microbacterium hydrothermale]MCW2163302.1 carbohydrate ABC transporter substrate-binding protein, CUT1 family [Microbacterium hydrothermale]
MSTALTRPRRMVAITSLGAAGLLALTACTGGGGSASATSFSFLVNQENTTIPELLTSLSTDQCKAENDAQPLQIETVPQTQLDQKLQLLAGQNALPVQYAAGNAPALTKELAQGGQVLDLEKTLTDLGVIDQIEPAAISTIEQLYGGFNVLPYQYNIEGVWYNKQLLADNGIDVPSTWDDLSAGAAKLHAAGIQPFSASGEQGWPITRLISGYIFRDLGPDALQKVADGDAKLTDPEYVAAAQAIADLGADGYFGQGVGSIDYDTAFNTFLTGKAAFFYMGSWALANFADESANQIGSDNIGFMPFPDVAGGAGDSSQTPANVGLPMAMSAKAYNDDTGKWLTCIANNYGAQSLSAADTISGFKVNGDVQVDDLTALVQDRIASTQESVLWFEALFNAKATETSQKNAAQLVTGAISAQDFMGLVQADLG